MAKDSEMSSGGTEGPTAIPCAARSAAGVLRDPERNLDIEAMIRAGWVYRDVPLCLPDAWQMLMEAIGDGNRLILATTIRQSDKAQRGQLLISPAGIAHMTAWRAARAGQSTAETKQADGPDSARDDTDNPAAAQLDRAEIKGDQP